MNDDLHKTYEPEPVPDDVPVTPTSSGSWKMPEPVFRRSGGKVGGQASGEVQKAPSTIVPERLRTKEPDIAKPPAEPPPPPMPTVEAQPTIAEDVPHEDLDFSELREAPPTASKLPIGLIAAVIIALVGIISALVVAVVFGYIAWR